MRRIIGAWLISGGIALCAVSPLSATVAVDDGTARLCDLAAAQAAQDSGVPLSILQAIARVESGRAAADGLVAWPWAINFNGQGHFFASKAEAMSHAAALIEQGEINFDIGCFQVNLRWHSKGFTSLEDAFDPRANAAYAARFLTELLQETGDWAGAVAAYHSRSPDHADPYLDKVKSVWRSLQTGAPAPAPEPSARRNDFPLLRVGRGANGSLVPQLGAQTTRFSLR